MPATMGPITLTITSETVDGRLAMMEIIGMFFQDGLTVQIGGD